VSEPGPSLRDLYDTDFYAWTRAQAESLRRLAAEPVGATLGADRLAAEIEALGEERRKAVHATVSRVMALLLQLRLSEIGEFRQGWQRDLGHERGELLAKIGPSLERDVTAHLEPLYQEAVELARRRFGLWGERLAPARIPLRCPFTLAEIKGTG
jgi:hypothetical protein